MWNYKTILYLRATIHTYCKNPMFRYRETTFLAFSWLFLDNAFISLTQWPSWLSSNNIFTSLHVCLHAIGCSGELSPSGKKLSPTSHILGTYKLNLMWYHKHGKMDLEYQSIRLSSNEWLHLNKGSTMKGIVLGVCHGATVGRWWMFEYLEDWSISEQQLEGIWHSSQRSHAPGMLNRKGLSE